MWRLTPNMRYYKFQWDFVSEKDWIENSLYTSHMRIIHSLTSEMKSSNDLSNRTEDAIYMFYLRWFYRGNYTKVKLIGQHVRS